MAKSGIYKITFNGTDKFYIGSSYNIGKRKSAHERDLFHRRHGNIIMQRCYDKYGEPIFEILEEVDRWDCPVFKVLLLSLEQEYIDRLKPDINIYQIAGSAKNNTPSEETRKKLSIANKGKKLTEEHKIKIGESNAFSRGALTSKDVIEIRRVYKNSNKYEGMQIDLSLMYGVSISTIKDAAAGRSYKHIKDSESDGCWNPVKIRLRDFSDSEVLEIRSLFDSVNPNNNQAQKGFSLRSLGKKFNVDKSVIRNIVKRKTYKHI